MWQQVGAGWQALVQALPQGAPQLGAQALPQGAPQLGAQALPHGAAQLGAAQLGAQQLRVWPQQA